MWGPQYQDETNYLRVYMAQIRRKLEPDPARPRYFITEPGHGLSLRAEGAVMNQTSSRRRIAGYALATLGTAALVAVLLPFRDDITPLSNGFVFLALVVVTGAVGGLVPGIVSSFTSFLAFNYFFIPPYDTFAIGRGDHVVVLFVFLGLSVLISVLMARATSRAEAAEARERELRTLQDLSRALVEHGPDPDNYAVVVRQVVSRFGFRDGALFIQPRGDASGLDETPRRQRGTGVRSARRRGTGSRTTGAERRRPQPGRPGAPRRVG